jgi:hypothetical protein
LPAAIINDFIYSLSKIESVEEEIKSKKHFMINYLRHVPLRGNYCYFCLENYYYCVACPYAKHHNNCNHENSDWRSIDKTLIDLVDKINTEYYRGEKY